MYVHYVRFNSTIVRLKVEPEFPVNSSVLCFNSTIVRLKEFSEQHRVEITTGFNSTIVRLKEYQQTSARRDNEVSILR